MSTPNVLGTTWMTTPTIMMQIEMRSAHSLPTKLASVPPTNNCAKPAAALAERVLQVQIQGSGLQPLHVPVDAQGMVATIPDRLASML